MKASVLTSCADMDRLSFVDVQMSGVCQGEILLLAGGDRARTELVHLARVKGNVSYKTHSHHPLQPVY